jgi:hypothetical protein
MHPIVASESKVRSHCMGPLKKIKALGREYSIKNEREVPKSWDQKPKPTLVAVNEK